jgi:Lanthionine-containing peptide SapB precursor RamS
MALLDLQEMEVAETPSDTFLAGGDSSHGGSGLSLLLC